MAFSSIFPSSINEILIIKCRHNARLRVLQMMPYSFHCFQSIVTMSVGLLPYFVHILFTSIAILHEPCSLYWELLSFYHLLVLVVARKSTTCVAVGTTVSQ